MTTIGPASPVIPFQTDANPKTDTPLRQDRPDRAIRPERPEVSERPHDGGSAKLAHMTRRFVNAAKEILQNGGEFEDITKLARKVVAEHPALKEFPPFQKIMERIAYHLGGSHDPFVGRAETSPVTDATAGEASGGSRGKARISLLI